MDLIELIKKYFAKTPRDQILQDWEKTEEFDSVGPTMEEFLNYNNNLKKEDDEKNREEKSREEN